MRSEKGITLLALIIIVVVLVVIAGISIVVYRNGKNAGTSVEDIAASNEAMLDEVDEELVDEEDKYRDPEIDVDAELNDGDDTEITEEEELESESVSESEAKKTNPLDPDANIGDEDV